MSDQSAPTEDFLRAEEAAQQLVQSLRRLDAEAESYSTAGKTLDQVASEVRELASKTSEVAERSAEAVEAIRSIGSVQILEQVQALSAGAEASSVAIGNVDERVHALADQVAVVDSALKSLDSKIDGVASATQAAAAKTVEAINQSAQSSQASIDAAAKAAKTAMYAAIAAAILAALAAVLTRF